MSEKRKIPVGSDRHYYMDICLLGVPLISMAYFYYGLRPVLMCGYAVLLGNLCDRLISMLRRREYDPTDWTNESFSMVISLLLPASCPWSVLTVAVLAGVLIGKEAFGGYGNYPFHPAAVGYAVAAVSWPDAVMRYPAPGTVLPLGAIDNLPLTGGMSNMLKSGAMPTTDMLNMLLGNYAGPIGTTAILVLLACGLFLWVRRDISLYAPLSFLGTCAAVAFFYPRRALADNAMVVQTTTGRLDMVMYELVSGAILFGALFLATEPFTVPRRHRGGQILYGVLLGLMTTAFRYFGAYDTGICFAVLTLGSVSQWIDRLIDWLYRSAGRLQRTLREKKGGSLNEG